MIRIVPGLRYDDLLIEEADVEEALKRVPKVLYDEHMMRCKRAQDLQMKYKVLPEELQLLQQPLNHWLRPYIEEARIARIEEEELNEGLFVTPDDANAKMISWYHVGKLRRYGNDQDDKERRPPALP